MRLRANMKTKGDRGGFPGWAGWLVAVGLAVALFWKDDEPGKGEGSEKEKDIPERVGDEAEGANSEVSPEVTRGEGENTGEPGVEEAGSGLAGAVPFRLLLEQVPGQISSKEAYGYLDAFKHLAVADEAGLLAVLRSGSAPEASLAAMVAVEVFGLTAEGAATALAHPSAVPASELAERLYLKGRFEDWSAFVERAAAGLSESHRLELFEVACRGSGRPELPAGLSMLGLGRGTRSLTVEFLRRNPNGLESLKGFLLAEGKEGLNRAALLDVADEARPEGYLRTLRELVAELPPASSLRRQVVRKLGQTAGDAETLRFLTEFTGNVPDDPLTSTLAEALEYVKVNAEGTVKEDGRAVGELLRSSLDERPDGFTNRSYAAMVAYVGAGLRGEAISADVSLLRRSRDLLAARKVKDHVWLRNLADVDYLLWRTRKETP